MKNRCIIPKSRSRIFLIFVILTISLPTLSCGRKQASKGAFVADSATAATLVEPVFNNDGSHTISYGQNFGDTPISANKGVLITGRAILYRAARLAPRADGIPRSLLSLSSDTYPIYRIEMQSAEAEGGYYYESLSRRDGSFKIGPVHPGAYHMNVSLEEASGFAYADVKDHLGIVPTLVHVSQDAIGSSVDLGDTIRIDWLAGWDKQFVGREIRDFSEPNVSEGVLTTVYEVDIPEDWDKRSDLAIDPFLRRKLENR